MFIRNAKLQLHDSPEGFDRKCDSRIWVIGWFDFLIFIYKYVWKQNHGGREVGQVFGTLVDLYMLLYPSNSWYTKVRIYIESTCIISMIWHSAHVTNEGFISSPMHSIQQLAVFSSALEVNASQDPFTNWWVVEDRWWNICKGMQAGQRGGIKLAVPCPILIRLDYLGFIWQFTWVWSTSLGRKIVTTGDSVRENGIIYVSRLWELSHPKCASGSACISYGYELLTMDHWVHCSCTKFAHKNLNLLGWPVFPPIWHTPVKAWEGQQRVCAGGCVAH